MKIHDAEQSRRDSITLKWGTLKAWNFGNNPIAAQLVKDWAALGYSFSAMMQHDTPDQKEILCKIIDAANLNTIRLDWEAKEVSKQEAKDYVMNYGK